MKSPSKDKEGLFSNFGTVTPDTISYITGNGKLEGFLMCPGGLGK
jgi:hypothetical protein